jgi:hypothetical protein
VRKALLALVLLSLAGCGGSPKEKPIDPACLKTLKPLERYMKERSEVLDDTAREEIRLLLEKPYDVCSRRDFAIYRDTVIVPWASDLMPD